MILPPPGSHGVQGVIEKRGTNVTEQRVLLDTQSAVPGQNYLDVKLYGADPSDNSSYRRFTQARLQNEAYNATNGVARQPSALFVQNSYGPFGYASGKGPSGDTCIYGWQQIRSPENLRSSLGNLGIVQVRARLCDRLAGESELLKTMLGYTITGGYGSEAWNPYGKPKSAEAVLTGTVQPMSAAFQPSPDPAATASIPAPTVVRQAKPITAAAVPQSMMEPALRGPAVPLPGPATGQTVPAAGVKPASAGGTVMVPMPPEK